MTQKPFFELIKSVVLITAAFSITACTGSKKQSATNTYDVKGIVSNSTLAPADKAAKLAAISEQLFTLTNFMHSDELADMALAIDPTNVKAQFYKHAAAPLMNLKGIAVRVRASMTADEILRHEQQIANFPDSALKTFLLDGKEDLKTEKDMQAFLDTYINALNDMRVFLKNNKNMEIILNANDWSWNEFLKRRNTECMVDYDESNIIGGISCPMKKAGEIILNAADLEGLQHGYAAMQVLFSFYNSYDVTGMLALTKLPIEQRETMKPSETYGFLSMYKDFGVYRSSSQLQKVTEMGLDYTTALRWAVKMQKTLCKEGYETEKNRPGYLFNKGLCVESKNPVEDEKQLALIELALNGGLVPFSYDDETGAPTIMYKPALFFTNPVKDLKQLKPQFASCPNSPETDDLVSVSDSTWNGVFPKGEVNMLLQASHEFKCAIPEIAEEIVHGIVDGIGKIFEPKGSDEE